MMLGYLLARAGIKTTVLEKHADFLRDFRGDTIHPSTLQLLFELGLLDEFLKLPHTEIRTLTGIVGDATVTLADFSHVRSACKFMALVPQWDFLDFLAARGKRYPTFDLHMSTEAVDLIERDGRIAGVRALGPGGPIEIEAGLVVGADGRRSLIRDRAGFAVEDVGAPMDVLWMRVARKPEDVGAPFGRMAAGKVLVMLDRDTYWQCAYLIPKGGYDAIRARGIQALRDDLVATAPLLAGRVDELRDWDDIKLLTVTVDHLRRWHRPGLLCIGDAAHAMSPIGGVGINLAVQDAVAAANLLYAPLCAGVPTDEDLARVQRRREFPVAVIQRLQVAIQNNIIGRVLSAKGPLRPPPFIKLFGLFPVLRRIPAQLVGMGIRPEHIHTPEATLP